VSTVDDRHRLACLASDDHGRTWYEYAVSDRMFPLRVYSIGTARELTATGQIIGVFTHVDPRAKTYYEDDSGEVYFFRIQAGLCRAWIIRVALRDGHLTIAFDRVQGQPVEWRLGFGDETWSPWKEFTQECTIPVEDTPIRYQLKSRLGVICDPQPLELPAE
jgi:hypothetical protein